MFEQATEEQPVNEENDILFDEDQLNQSNLGFENQPSGMKFNESLNSVEIAFNQAAIKNRNLESFNWHHIHKNTFKGDDLLGFENQSSPGSTSSKLPQMQGTKENNLNNSWSNVLDQSPTTENLQIQNN